MRQMSEEFNVANLIVRYFSKIVAAFVFGAVSTSGGSPLYMFASVNAAEHDVALQSTHPFETLPGGRVVLQILDERVAFHPKDGEIINFYLPAENRSRKGPRFPIPTATAVTLAELLTGTENSQALLETFRSEKSNVWVPIVIGTAPFWKKKVEPRLLLGILPWDKVTRSDFGINIIRENFRLSQTRTLIFRRDERSLYPNRGFPIYGGISPNGFETWQSKNNASEARGSVPKISRYFLQGKHRKSLAIEDLKIGCGWGIRNVRGCSMKLYSTDMRIQMRWGWYEDRFPEESWIEVDQTFREIAAHIFIDRKMEDFQ